ncbi:MAG: hypothetical protein Fur0019_03400 [Tibeticola sp.]
MRGHQGIITPSEDLLIDLYWNLAVPTGLLALLLVGLNLGGRPLSAATPVGLSLLMAGLVLAALGSGYKLGTTGRRSGWSVTVVVASWFAFAIPLFVNGLLHQKTWNQRRCPVRGERRGLARSAVAR